MVRLEQAKIFNADSFLTNFKIRLKLNLMVFIKEKKLSKIKDGHAQ